MALAAVLALLCTPLLFTPGPCQWASAQEDSGSVTVETGDFETPEDAEDAQVSDEAKGQEFADSAKELQEKLAQLKALLDAKGEGTDPALQERLAGLQNQLETLGLGDLSNMGGLQRSPELSEFVQTCIALSVRKAGMNRPSVIGALRRLGDDKMSMQEAAQIDLYRLFAVCANELTEEEHQNFKKSKLAVMPKAYVDAAKKPEAEALVTGLDAAIWAELKVIAGGLSKELGGRRDDSTGPSVMWGVVAFVPMSLVIGFLTKKFIDMQKSQEEKKDKKASKKTK